MIVFNYQFIKGEEEKNEQEKNRMSKRERERKKGAGGREWRWKERKERFSRHIGDFKYIKIKQKNDLN